MNNQKRFNNDEAYFAQKQAKKNKSGTSYAFKWTFIAFLVCITLFGLMYLAVNSDSIGMPGISRFIRKSPMAPAFMPFSGKQNILIMGVDSNGSKTDPFKGTRTDTILLVSIAGRFELGLMFSIVFRWGFLASPPSKTSP